MWTVFLGCLLKDGAKLWEQTRSVLLSVVTSASAGSSSGIQNLGPQTPPAES